MTISNNALEKAIAYKVGKFSGEEITSEDLLKIEEISLSNQSLSGKKQDINLFELSFLPNIKNLVLQYFEIDDDAINLINNMRDLNSLHFASCKFLTSQELRNPTLKSLVLNNCIIKDLDKIYSPEVLEVIGEDNFRLDKLNGKEKIRKLFLRNSKVKSFHSIESFQMLELLNLDGSLVDDMEILKKLRKEGVVSKKEEYLPTL